MLDSRYCRSIARHRWASICRILWSRDTRVDRLLRLQLIDPRGDEDRADVIRREAMELIEQEAASLLRDDWVRLATVAVDAKKG